MTPSEMHIEFKIGLDKSDVLNYPNYEPEEIDIFLNKSQENLVKQRYSGNNAARQSVEETQKRRSDLGNLTSNSNIDVSAVVSTTDNKPNGIFVCTPDDCWFPLEREVTISYTDCNGDTATKRIDVKQISHDTYLRTMKDPFSKPYNLLVTELPFGYTVVNGEEVSRIELITDGTYTIQTYHIRYIRRPRAIDFINNVSCELFDIVHREIVDGAVNLALENIESQRLNTQSIQTMRNE